MRRLYLYRNGPIILLLVLFACTNVYALQGSTAANGSNVQAVHDIGITGAGINIGFVSSQNVFVGHNAFRDANGVIHAENVNSDLNNGFWHDTVMAGMIISQGQLPNHPNDIGVAPGAMIHCYRLGSSSGTSLVKILNELTGSRNCKIIITGFEHNTEPNGQTQETLKYDYYADVCDVIFANAAGNIGSRITVFGDAYNGITTGGLAEIQTDIYLKVGLATNDGPTADGRRKPDITAPSTNQVVPGYNNGDPNYWSSGWSDGATSWAVPHTAGVAALLLEYADQTADTDDGHNVVIKATIVNSAFPNIHNRDGLPTYPANPENVWHPQRGYGRIDAYRAYLTLSADRVVAEAPITSMIGWAYDTMSNNATHNYFITGKKNERLILTVTWNRKIDKSGSVYEPNLPLFNIDVTIKNPAGGTIFSEIDDVNNLEKIDSLLPADGNYTVSLHNTSTKSQAYGLAFEFLQPLTGDFNIDYVVDEYDLCQMAFEWLTVGPDTDIVPDDNHIVNWRDFAAFADDWLKTDGRYYNP